MIDKTKYNTYLDDSDIQNGERCQVACPLHIDMPNIYDLMDKGKYKEAYLLLKSANPFPAITGRVCFAPCEHACTRGMLDTPVAIREVEYFLSEYIQSESTADLATYKEGSLKGTRKESVAVIGSGPAGMAAAWDLAHYGYKVTIYEKHPVCGGMAHLGIPVFKILRKVIDHEIAVLQRLGVTIVNNVEIGKDLTLDDLKAQGVSAICIAVGADVGNKLNIPGAEECDKIYESTEILRLVRMGDRKKLGDNILIIGGGNTAMDISRTCKRLGTKKVTVACIESKDSMPAFDYEFEAAKNEGVNFQFLAMPKSIEMKNKILVGLKCSHVDPKSFENNPGKDIIVKQDSDFTIPADSIILSISQKPNLELLGENYSDAKNERGLIKQELERGKGGLDGIFAAGDVITGPRSIVSAFASGRSVASHIDSYIRKSTEPIKKKYSVLSSKKSGVKFNFEELKRQRTQKKIPLNLEGNFEIINQKFSANQAREECDRCMRCNKNIQIDSKGCINCNYCVNVCPVRCLAMVTENNRVFTNKSELETGEIGTAVMIKDELCIRCGLCIDVCPVEVISFKCFDIKGPETLSLEKSKGLVNSTI